MSTNKANKLNVLLAKTEQLAPSAKKVIIDTSKFFKDKQTAFKGERKTYTPASDTIDIPSERGVVAIVSTVKEKLDYVVETSAEYIDALFAQEATNASGIAKAHLIVDGTNFGELSSLELLRLQTFVKSTDFEQLYSNIPVRSDAELWEPTSEEAYVKRSGIFESPLQSGVKKSTQKTNFILPDPNVQFLKDATAYKPVVGTNDTIIELGTYTYQKFSGEMSHTQRALLLRQRSKLLTAITEALKIANDVEAVKSTVTAEKIFGFIHGVLS